MYWKKYGILVLFCFSLSIIFHKLIAQEDTTANQIDSFLLKQKVLLGKLAKNIMAEKTVTPLEPQRNDLLVSRYKGKTIRRIIIKSLDFGTAITDTANQFKNTLTRWANDFHHKTREDIILDNLF